MKTNIMKYIILLLLVAVTADAGAVDVAESRKWSSMSSDQLLKTGRIYEQRDSMEKALLIYSVLCEKYQNADDEKEIRNCCRAYVEKHYIYMSHYFDYSMAYENIKDAQKLQKKVNMSYDFVNHAISAFYHNLATICNDEVIEKKAISYGKEAFYSAYGNDDKVKMNNYMLDLLKFSGNIDDLTVIDDVWGIYKDDKSDEYRFNKMFYDFLNLFGLKDYPAASDMGEKMLALYAGTTDYKRILLSYTTIINAYGEIDDNEKVLEYIAREEELSRRLEMYNNVVKTKSSKEKIYRKMGDKARADSCLNEYLLFKDSLINVNQMSNIYKVLYGDEYIKMESKLDEISLRNKFYNRIIIIVTFFTLILLGLTVLLYTKIKQLKKSNLTIFNNNMEILKREEKDREKLKDYIKKLEDGQGENKLQENNGDSKYKKNLMSEDDKKKILDKILTVMENVDEICSDSFSAARLAELADSKYNYVSLVINEYYGCNFNTFLNNYRIKEACRRLADNENYGKYTIDTISASVGFKSTSTLNKSFKKIIGLTPSQYRKIAKEKTSDK